MARGAVAAARCGQPAPAPPRARRRGQATDGGSTSSAQSKGTPRLSRSPTRPLGRSADGSAGTSRQRKVSSSPVGSRPEAEADRVSSPAPVPGRLPGSAGGPARLSAKRARPQAFVQPMRPPRKRPDLAPGTRSMAGSLQRTSADSPCLLPGTPWRLAQAGPDVDLPVSGNDSAGWREDRSRWRAGRRALRISGAPRFRRLAPFAPGGFTARPVNARI